MRHKRFRKPHRIKKRKPLLKGRFFWNIIFILTIIGGGFYFFAFSDFFRIKEVVITGQQRIVSEDIKLALQQELKKSLLFINSSKIKEAVLQKFPQIAELEVKKKLPNILNVVLAERKEVGVFCHKDKCFLLDSEGVVFQDSVKESNLPNFYNQTLSFSDNELVLGKSVFDKETMRKILMISASLEKDNKISVKEFSLVSPTRLNIKTSEGWALYFNIKKDLNWQMSALTTLLEKELSLEKRKNLQYIDLRFDKIFIYPSLN